MNILEKNQTYENKYDINNWKMVFIIFKYRIQDIFHNILKQNSNKSI